MVETSIKQPIIGTQGFQERPFEGIKERSDFLPDQSLSTASPSLPYTTSSSERPLLDQTTFAPSPIQPLTQQTSSVVEVPATVIKEKPVLERVEKFQRTDIHKKVHIAEKHIQDIVEVREIPIQKRFVHPVQQLNVQDQALYEVEGKDAAEFEIQRMIQELRERDMNHQVEVKQHNEVFVHDHEPTRQVNRETVMHYVITKPVITEIHEQPIEEVHEQTIQRVIYEKPILRVIRSDNVTTEVERLQKGIDLSGFVPTSTTNNFQGAPFQGLSSTTAQPAMMGTTSTFPQQQTGFIGQTQPLSSTIPTSPLSNQQIMTGTLSSESPMASSSIVDNLSTAQSTPLLGTSTESSIPLASDKLPYQETTTMPLDANYTRQTGVPKMGFGEKVTNELGKALSGKKKKNKNVVPPTTL